MFKWFNQCDVFVALWGLYYLQGILYPSGIINQVIQLTMILMGLISLWNYITQETKHIVVNTTVLLIAMYCIYGSIIIICGDGVQWTADSTYLKNSFNSLLPIIFFFIQTKEGKLTQSKIRYYTLFILAVLIPFYFFFKSQLLNEYDSDNVTNNIGYMFVAVIPVIYFFYKNTLTQYVLLALTTFFILMGMKRGAIVIAACCILVFLYSGIREGSTAKKIYTIILSILIVAGIAYYVGYMMQTNEYFISRIESTIEGNSSGRDYIYTKIWNTITEEQNLFYILFGHGANSTIRYAGNFAHQDWLETACNNGLLGITILLIFFISLGNTVWRSRKYLQPHFYYCFLTLSFICFTKTIFSMSIQNFDMYQSMLLGYLLYWDSVKKTQRQFLLRQEYNGCY